MIAVDLYHFRVKMRDPILNTFLFMNRLDVHSKLVASESVALTTVASKQREKTLWTTTVILAVLLLTEVACKLQTKKKQLFPFLLSQQN